MASYTIEDIEFIRRKSGIGYQEAIALLDYHGGDVMKALVDLERNGKLKGSAETVREQPQEQPKRSFLQTFLQTRLVINKKEIVIANLSVVFCIIALLVSKWLVLGSILAAILLGYRIRITTLSDTNNEKIDKMVRSAADNVKRTASSFAKGVGDAIERRANQKSTAAPAAEKKPVEDFGASAEAPQADEAEIHEAPVLETPEEILREMEEEAAAHDVPTIQVPVKVDSTDGSVVYTTDAEGYGTATIE